MKKLLFNNSLIIALTFAGCSQTSNHAGNNTTDSLVNKVIIKSDTPATTNQQPIQGETLTPLETNKIQNPITEKGNPPQQDTNKTTKVIKHGSPNQSYIDSLKAAKKKQKENLKN